MAVACDPSGFESRAERVAARPDTPMRVHMRQATTARLLGGSLGPALALGQHNPSPQQILKSLPATRGSDNTTCDIRIATPRGGTPTQARAPVQASSVSLNVDFATGAAALTMKPVQTRDAVGHALGNRSLVTWRFRIESQTGTRSTALRWTRRCPSVGPRPRRRPDHGTQHQPVAASGDRHG